MIVHSYLFFEKNNNMPNCQTRQQQWHTDAAAVAAHGGHAMPQPCQSVHF
jgi:hypothetical protein